MFKKRRRLSRPASMAGASEAELLALKPVGWLLRPMPVKGWRMISPGSLPGALGVISYVAGGAPGFRAFARRPSARIFTLNSACERPLLVEVLRDWSSVANLEKATGEVPVLAEALEGLLRDGAITVYEDPLEGDELNLDVELDKAVAAVRDPHNYWRDADADPARSIFGIMITENGRQLLAQS